MGGLFCNWQDGFRCLMGDVERGIESIMGLDAGSRWESMLKGLRSAERGS